MKKISAILLLFLSLLLVSCDKTIKYDVNFYNNIENEEISETISVEEFSLINEPKGLVNGDKHLIGWFEDLSDETTKWDFTEYLVEYDTSLYAKWEDAYNVTFVLNNEEEDKVIEVAPRNKISAPEDLTNGQRVLTGWFLNIDLSGEAWSFNDDIVRSDITLYARWSAQTREKAVYDGEGTLNMRGDDPYKNAEDINLDTDIFEVISKMGTVHVGLNKAGYMRIYGNAGALTINIHESFKISDVTFGFGSNRSPGIIAFDNNENEISNYGTTLKYNNLETSSITVRNTNAAGNNIDINYIDITYLQIGPDPERESNINKPEIYIPTEETLYELKIGDVFTPPEFTAIDLEDGDVDVNLDTTTLPNVNKAGLNYVWYSATDSDGHETRAYITVIVREEEFTQSSSYYEGTADLTGEELKSYLNRLLNETLELQTYAVARKALEIADRDPNNFDNVLLIYDRDSDKGKWDHPIWEREHVWPNSMLGIPRVENSQANIGSDLHNLRAIRPHVNQTRSNYLFVEPEDIKQSNGIVTSSDYYPGYDDRGDVARILFYVNTVWELEIREDIEMLVRWHLDDPVDEFEKIRNEVIYSYQGNRNPYIDHPEFVEKIYGTITTSNNETLSFVIEIPVTDIREIRSRNNFIM